MKKTIFLFPWLIGVIFLFPIVAGLMGTLIFSLGYLPGISDTLSNQGWGLLFEHPSLWQSTFLTLFIGFGATFLAVIGAVLACVYLDSIRLFRRSLFLFLSVPHFAIGVGLIFLFSPTGWFIRAIDFFLFEISEPLGFSLVKDPYGLSLIFALIIKETPFLIMMSMVILQQINSDRQLQLAQTLGYAKENAFFNIILPQLLPKLRLPIFAVLVYSLSNIELSIIIGPNIPQPLILLFHYWFLDAQTEYQYAANAGAIYILGITLLCMAMWVGLERLVIRFCLWRSIRGKRDSLVIYIKPFIAGYFYTFLVLLILSIFALLLWAVSKQWFFPDFLPQSYNTKNIIKYSVRLFPSLLNTLLIGGVATLVGLVLVIGALEYESFKPKYQHTQRYFDSPLWFWVAYLPLIIPSISFMFGVYVLFLYLDLNHTWIGIFWVHLLFIIPYLFLSLSSNYLSFNHRYVVQALLLSHSYWKALFKIKLPMLAKTIVFAFAIGFSVSVAQYITTLYIGGGRIGTITTEVLSSLSGSNRNVLSIYTLYQWILPLVVFFIAFLIPSYQKAR
jgi:putative thiamine transport system permease protein